MKGSFVKTWAEGKGQTCESPVSGLINRQAGIASATEGCGWAWTAPKSTFQREGRTQDAKCCHVPNTAWLAHLCHSVQLPVTQPGASSITARCVTSPLGKQRSHLKPSLSTGTSWSSGCTSAPQHRGCSEFFQELWRSCSFYITAPPPLAHPAESARFALSAVCYFGVSRRLARLRSHHKWNTARKAFLKGFSSIY